MLSENNSTTNNNYNNGSTTILLNQTTPSIQNFDGNNFHRPHWFETKFDSIILNSMKQIKRKSITAHTIAIQKYLDL